MWPEPDSETRKPNEGFAITLIHGAGVRKPSPRTVTYSRPLSANPPRPLKKSRARWGSGTSRRLAARALPWDGRRHSFCPLRSSDLLGQRAPPAEQHRSRDCLKQRPLLRRDQIRPQEENAAAHVARVRREPQSAAAHESIQGDLQLLGIRGGPFIDDDHDRRIIVSCASIHARAAIDGRFRDLPFHRCAPEQWANRRRFRGPTARNAPVCCG